MSEYITTGGDYLRKKGDTFVTNDGKKLAPKQVQQHLRATGTKLHNIKECSDTFVDYARNKKFGS